MKDRDNYRCRRQRSGTLGREKADLETGTKGDGKGAETAEQQWRTWWKGTAGKGDKEAFSSLSDTSGQFLKRLVNIRRFGGLKNEKPFLLAAGLGEAVLGLLADATRNYAVGRIHSYTLRSKQLFDKKIAFNKGVIEV